MDADGIDQLLGGADAPTPIRHVVGTPRAAAGSKGTRKTRKGGAAKARADGVTKMPAPPLRRETASARPMSAGRRTRPAGGGSARRSASARRAANSPDKDTAHVTVAPPAGASRRSTGAPAGQPAWQDTQEESQLDALRAALTAISTAESELEEIRQQDEEHMREQDAALKERREQADRLEKAELRIQELVAHTGTHGNGDADPMATLLERVKMLEAAATAPAQMMMAAGAQATMAPAAAPPAQNAAQQNLANKEAPEAQAAASAAFEEDAEADAAEAAAFEEDAEADAAEEEAKNEMAEAAAAKAHADGEEAEAAAARAKADEEQEEARMAIEAAAREKQEVKMMNFLSKRGIVYYIREIVY